MSNDNEQSRPAEELDDGVVLDWADERGIAIIVSLDGSCSFTVGLEGEGVLTFVGMQIRHSGGTLRCVFTLPVKVPRDKRERLTTFFNLISRKTIGGSFSVLPDGVVVYEIDTTEKMLLHRDALYAHLDWALAVGRTVLGVYHDGIAALVLGFESAASAASMCEASLLPKESA